MLCVCVIPQSAHSTKRSHWQMDRKRTSQHIPQEHNGDGLWVVVQISTFYFKQTVIVFANGCYIVVFKYDKTTHRTIFSSIFYIFFILLKFQSQLTQFKSFLVWIHKMHSFSWLGLRWVLFLSLSIKSAFCPWRISIKCSFQSFLFSLSHSRLLFKRTYFLINLSLYLEWPVFEIHSSTLEKGIFNSCCCCSVVQIPVSFQVEKILFETDCSPNQFGIERLQTFQCIRFLLGFFLSKHEQEKIAENFENEWNNYGS